MNSQETLFQQLGSVVVGGMEELCVPGVSVGILHNGQEESGGWGITSVENPLPVTDKTLFQIGSVTKTVTATVALRLVETGKLKLDEPLLTYLPDLRLADEGVTRQVTMRHLLTHTGGWIGDYFEAFGNGDDALAQIVNQLPNMPQLTPLGKVFHYNNMGFYLAGRVLEVIEGKPFETVVKETIFEPLGMDASCFVPEDAITRRFVVGHEVDDNDQVTVCRPWAVPRSHSPAGGILSTAQDLLRYACFCLGETGGLLQAGSLAMMQMPQITIRPGHSSVGLSWFIDQVDGVQVLSHDGGTRGQECRFFFVRQHHLAAAILTNSDRGQALIDPLYRWILLHYLGVEVKDPELSKRPDEQLLPYVGRYISPTGDIEATLHEGGLMLRLEPKGGFPTPDSPPFPAPPPVDIVFFGDNCAIVPDGPFKGMEAEFLRDPDSSSIGWLRLSSRIYRRAVES